MEILSIDADQKLAKVASSIGQNPHSWQGWFCLEIKLQDVDDESYRDCPLWIKSIIESYLKDIEGRTYFCSNKSIHILCKTSSPQILHQSGQQICDLIYAENALAFHYTVYDLAESGFAYAQNLLERVDNIFSLPPSVQAEIKGTVTPKVEPVIQNSSTVKVLLVEDDPMTRWMVRNALKYKCDFVTAQTVNKSFGVYSSYQPDIVFLDIDLPDGSGYDVLEWIMRNDPGACVVMFSSNDKLDNISNALDEGASGFIAKPFLKESLLHYIHNHTG